MHPANCAAADIFSGRLGGVQLSSWSYHSHVAAAVVADPAAPPPPPWV